MINILIDLIDSHEVSSTYRQSLGSGIYRVSSTYRRSRGPGSHNEQYLQAKQRPRQPQCGLTKKQVRMERMREQRMLGSSSDARAVLCMRG